MSKSQFRITVDTDDGTHKLASLNLSKHGDLFISIKIGDKNRDFGLPAEMTGSKLHNRDIREFRFTIHPTNHSATINRINLHQVLRDGGGSHPSFATNGMKEENEFVVLFSRRGHDPKSENKEKHQPGLSLGWFDCQIFTIHWTILISRKELLFKFTHPKINIKSFFIGDYNLTVLYSFLPLVGPSVGMTINTWIEPEGSTSFKGIFDLLYCNEEEALAIHHDFNEILFNELLETIMKSFIFGSPLQQYYFKKRFGHYSMLKNGTKNCLEYELFKSQVPTIPPIDFSIGILE